MTEKQKRFADEYLIDCNATRAYKAAYPNVKKDSTASVNASKLLRNTKVQAYIAEQLDKLHDEKTADAKEVIEYLTAVLRGESESETVIVEGTGDGRSKARSMMKHPDERERLKAAELLGKYHALFTDKAQIEGNELVQIVDDIP
jgi:phage terminase small subunit